MLFTVDRAKGGFQAHAWGDNSKLVFWTEVYTSKTGALHAIQVMQQQAATARVIDRTGS